MPLLKSTRRRQEPCFKFEPGLAAGVQRLLETPLVVNGASPTPITFCLAQAAAGGVPQYESPSTVLSLQTGTVPTYGRNTPFWASGYDLATLFNGGGFFQAASNALGDFTVEDLVPESVFRVPISGTNLRIADHRGTGAGWSLLCSSTGGQFFMSDGTNTCTVSFATIPGSWVHLIAFVRRAGSAVAYVNGVQGTPVACSAVNSITKATPLAIGAISGGGSAFNSEILYVALRSQASWLDTHLQAAVAAQRAQLLFGSRAIKYWGASATPSAIGSTSQVNQSRVLATGAVFRLLIGPGLLRVKQRKDANGLVRTGAVVSGQIQNLCLQSDAMGTTWTAVALTSTSSNGAAGSDGLATMDGAVGTNADTQHGWSQAMTLTAAKWCLSFEVRAGNKPWVYADDSTIANVSGYWNIAGAAKGTMGSAVADSGVEDCGGGLIRCWMVFTGTAAAHTIRILAADADGDNSTQGDASTVNIWVGSVNVHLGNAPACHIPTTTAAVTKAASSYVIPSVNNIGAGEGTVCAWFTSRALTATLDAACVLWSANDGTANNRIELGIDTSRRPYFAIRKTGGNAGDGTLTTAVLTGVPRKVQLSWDTNEARLMCDNGEEAVDLTVDIPTVTQICIGHDHATAQHCAPSIDMIEEVRCLPRFERSFLSQGR